MDKDTALKLALEALEEPKEHIAKHRRLEAITAINKALAQEQEPVATDWERIARVQNAKLMAMCNEAGGFEKLREVMDKYKETTPPQRTWVGLDDENMKELRDANFDLLYGVRWAERKLREKNGC